MFSFGVIGAIDDFAKVVHRRRIESGKSEKNITLIKLTESVLVSGFLQNLGWLW